MIKKADVELLKKKLVWQFCNDESKNKVDIAILKSSKDPKAIASMKSEVDKIINQMRDMDRGADKKDKWHYDGVHIYFDEALENLKGSNENLQSIIDYLNGNSDGIDIEHEYNALKSNLDGGINKLVQTAEFLRKHPK